MDRNIWRKFELQIIAIIIFIAFALSLCFYGIFYNQYLNLTINNLKDDAVIVHQYAEEIINEDSFFELNTRADEEKELYLITHTQLDEIRRIANILYLYTAKINENGEYIYVLDGLSSDSEDFRHIGDPIEEEIIPELEKCFNGEIVFSDNILATEWGVVYVTYFPAYDSMGNIVGAIGMEFDCATLYYSFRNVRILTIIISIILAVVFACVSIFILKRVVKNTEGILRKKDEMLIEATKTAQESNRAKSEFLSRMSHEIRTPMNAIMGMTTIADSTTDLSKVKHCLATIKSSSTQLLEIINDILDMSKIEAGKLELESAPLNIEKVLMKVCNLVIDTAEKKHQRFDIFISKDMRMHYIGDELRISQILTNLLANAVKFTPERGSVSLSVEEARNEGDFSVIRFAVTDTGIGMTEEQKDKLFVSFEQVDGSISRRFGGTGLGLAISKSLVEKMGGRVWVDSDINKGSTFSFEIKLLRASEQDKKVIFDGISPSDLRVLILDGDLNTRMHMAGIMEMLGIPYDAAEGEEESVRLVKAASKTHRPYDVIFMDFDLPDDSAINTAKALKDLIDKNTVIIMTSFRDWSAIQGKANEIGITRFIAKPLFPSSILDAINEVVGSTIRMLDLKAQNSTSLPDFSGMKLLLTEDIEINREIVLSLLEDSHIDIDTAENGQVAVNLVKADPNKYDMILMDIQMPEMDGYEATREIRALDSLSAKTIPIVAMTANAFKEDVERCLACGMNDHIAKPVDLDELIEKINKFHSPR